MNKIQNQFFKEQNQLFKDWADKFKQVIPDFPEEKEMSLDDIDPIEIYSVDLDHAINNLHECLHAGSSLDDLKAYDELSKAYVKIGNILEACECLSNEKLNNVL